MKMTYEEAMDRCVIIRDTLLSMDLTIVSNVDNIEWATMCAEAIEKQIPKKPILEADGYADGELVYDTWYCPNCDKSYEVDYDSYDFCPNCGQAIDWSDEDENRICI